MAERVILVLGASYAGFGIVHYTAKHILPQLPKDPNKPYRIVVVDPSSKFFLRHASPRAVASEQLMPDKHIFLNTVEGFEQYGSAVAFVQGSAIAWDPEKREVQIRRSDGQEEPLAYHALILATGTKTNSPLFSLQGTPHSDNLAALSKIRKQVSNAKHIIVGGGGPAGVETAGELGEMLNGRAGWFSSRPSNPQAEIVLYTNSEQLLPLLRPSIGKKAETFLNNVGVDVHYKTKVSSATPLANGKTKVMLHDGLEIVTDVYIPATGLSPMTEYVPKRLLDGGRYVRTNETTLRVDEAGPRVYAVGDVASCSRNGIMDIMGMTPVVASNLKSDLMAAHKDANGKAAGPDRVWTPGAGETQLVPVGRSKGVGAVFGWRLPSIMVWLIKGKDFMISEKSIQDRLMGNDWAKEK